MNLLISCNDNYLMPLEVMLHSFFKSNPSEDPHRVFMLRGSLTKEADGRINDLVSSSGGIYYSITVDSTDFDSAKTKSYISKETYFRILAADYLPEDIDRVLWLDADVLVRKPLDKLYNIDLEDNWAAACSYGPLMLSTIRRNAESLGLSDPDSYFNAGVMLYDLKACRKADLQSAWKAFLSKERNLMFPGQDLMNTVFDGHVKIVDYRIWNSMTHCIANKEDYDYAKENAAIVHFPGRAKPWEFNDIHFSDEWMEVYRRVFGDNKEPERTSYFAIKSVFRESFVEPKEKKDISVSVIIPAYNSWSTLPRCLDSIIPQLDDSMELIVIDDGSSDNSFNLLRDTFGNVGSFRFVWTSINRGAVFARNDGIRLARGNYIAFCDADDEWLPGKLAEQVAVLEDNPDIDIVFIQDRNVIDDTDSGSRRILDMSLKDNTFHLRSCLVRKKVFDNIGLLDESLKMRDDTEWIVRAISSGIKYKAINKELDIRHIKGSGLSVQTLFNEKERGKKRLDAFLKGIRRRRLENKPLYDLSILIPCYNASKYINEAISGCVSEKYKIEIIIVDDGSADDSVSVAMDSLNKTSFHGTVVSRPHRGQASSRNDALALSRGRWIMYLDADDHFLPDTIDKVMDLAETSDDSTYMFSFMAEDFISSEVPKEITSRMRIQMNPYRRMLSGCLLTRREVYDMIGGFDESLESSETAQWVLRFQNSELKMETSDIVTLARRYHSDNFGRKNRDVQMKSYVSIIRTLMKNKGN